MWWVGSGGLAQGGSGRRRTAAAKPASPAPPALLPAPKLTPGALCTASAALEAAACIARRMASHRWLAVRRMDFWLPVSSRTRGALREGAQAGARLRPAARRSPWCRCLPTGSPPMRERGGGRRGPLLGAPRPPGSHSMSASWRRDGADRPQLAVRRHLYVIGGLLQRSAGPRPLAPAPVP